MAKQEVFPKSSVLFWVVLVALFMAPVFVNAQSLPPSPVPYVYPNCVAGHACARMYTTVWAPVGNGFTEHMEFLDNLSNDATGKTPVVEWWATWFNVAPDQTVQYGAQVSGSYNNGQVHPLGLVDLSQCTFNNCKAKLDLLAPICDYNAVGKFCATPPAEMDLAIVGWVAVSDPNVMGQVTPPVLHTIASSPDGSVIYDHYEPATWVDQGYNAWYAPVTVGSGKSCSFGVVNLSDNTALQPILFAELLNVDGTVIDKASLPVMMYAQFQNVAFSCDDLFPKIKDLPSDKGTNAKLVVFGGIANIAITAYQIFGGGGMGGNVGSQAVFPYKK